MNLKLVAVLLLVAGEGLAIYAEMIAARTHAVAGQPFLATFLKMFAVIVVAGGFLVAGYMLGFKAFQNIWIVSAASITSILILEPILAYLVFQQLPTQGAVIGFVLGAIGFAAALFY